MSEQYQVEGSSAVAISASIESGVRQGRIDWGTQLPPVRVLAGDLQVSPGTVAKAYAELRRRGIVEADGRRGTRIRRRPPVSVAPGVVRLPPVPDGLLDLSSGEPDLALLPALGGDLRLVADDLGGSLGYDRAGVLPELVDAARPRLAADGVPVDDAAITVTGGTLDAIERLLTVHLRPGDAVAVEDPGWANLVDLVAALGLRAVPMTVDGSGPVPESLAEALQAGVQAVVITTRAQNPTGAAITAPRAGELRRILAGRPGLLVIEDDHAAELSDVAPSCIGPVTGSWAFVRSASKPYGPDLRIAVLAGDETSIARVAGRMRIGSGWVSTILQRLLLRLWTDPLVSEQIEAAAVSYRDRRTGLIEALAGAGQPASGATGINVWVPVPDETRAVTMLRDAGYAVAPGVIFRLQSPPGIRITVSPLTGADLDPLAAAIVAAAGPSHFSGPLR